MNYNRIYESIIEKRKAFPPREDEYSETHHIVPKCMGGTNDKSNLVELTPEEHYIAHQLLVKIYPDEPKLVKAAQMMIVNRPSNKLYGWLRRRFAEVQSESQKGNKNSQYGLRWIHNQELQKSKKILKNDPLPIGWKEGRKINWTDKTKTCPICNSFFEGKGTTCSLACKRENHRRKHQDKAYLLFEKFVNSPFESITEFAKHTTFTQPGLTKLFTKYVVGYKDIVVQGKATDIKDLKKLIRGRSLKEEQPTHNR